jgi:hypothetical protein
LDAGGPCPMKPWIRGETRKLSRMNRISGDERFCLTDMMSSWTDSLPILSFPQFSPCKVIKFWSELRSVSSEGETLIVWIA